MALKKYQEHLETQRLSKGTRKLYYSRAKAFIDKYGENFTPDNVALFLDSIKDNLKPSTYNSWYACLSSLCQFMVNEGLIGFDYTQSRQRIILAQSIPHTLTTQQINKLIKGLDEHYLVAISLALNGLRRAELLGLLQEDIIDGSRQPLLNVIGKRQKQRYVPMTRRVRQLWFAGSFMQYLPLNQYWKNPQSFSAWVARLGDRNGIKVTPHILRHCYGSKLLESGLTISEVSRLMGHSNVQTTHNFYIGMNIDSIAEKMKVIDL